MLGVIGLEKCFVHKVGFRYFVDLHVVVNGDRTVRQGHLIAHDVENFCAQQSTDVSRVLVHIDAKRETATAMASSKVLRVQGYTRQ